MLNYSAGQPTKIIRSKISKNLSANIVAAGNVVIWTPASGKRIVLHGFNIICNGAVSFRLFHGVVMFFQWTFIANVIYPFRFPDGGLDIFAIDETFNLTNDGATAQIFTCPSWGVEE